MGWRWRWGRPRAYECLTSFRTLPAACIENGGLNVRRSKQHNTHETVPPHSVSSLVAILVARGTGARGAHRHPYLQKQVVRGTGASRQTQRQNQKETVQKPQNSGYNSQCTGTGHGRGTGHGGRTSGPAADADCEREWEEDWYEERRHLACGLARGLGGPWVKMGGRGRVVGRGQGAGGRRQGVRPTPTMLALYPPPYNQFHALHHCVCVRRRGQGCWSGRWGGLGRVD